MTGAEYVRASIGVLLLGVMASAYAEDRPTVRVATEGAYAPWNFTRAGGELAGFEPDLMAIVCKRAKVNCVYSTQSWDGMIPSLNLGKVDVLMDSIVVTPEREQQVSFSIPYAMTPGVFAALKPRLLSGDSDQPAREIGTTPQEIHHSIADLRSELKGKSIGITTGTVYAPFIKKYFNDVATIRIYTTSADSLFDLKVGRIDTVFDDKTVIDALKEEPVYRDIKATGPSLSGPALGGGEALAFRHHDTALIKRFNSALQSAIDDGTVKRLSLEWFKTDLSP